MGSHGACILISLAALGALQFSELMEVQDSCWKTEPWVIKSRRWVAWSLRSAACHSHLAVAAAARAAQVHPDQN